jgi:AcrR family transcriptional regulator/predicted transcriptional regulator
VPAAPDGAHPPSARGADGIRLNHRAAWVLKVIAREGGLSNAQIAERVGVRGKGHISRILSALNALGLVVNAQDDPTPAVPNAWHLTPAGERCEQAIRDETPSVVEMRGPRSAPARAALRIASAPGPGGSAGAVQDRILAVLVRLVSTKGLAAVSVEHVARDAHVSPEAFHELFEDLSACALAAFEQGVERAGARAEEAAKATDGWLDSLRAGLRAMLEFFDEQPELARFCLVHSADAGPPLRDARREVLARFTRIVDSEREPARGYPPRLTAEGVANGVLGILHGQLLAQNARPLSELLNPLMSFIVLPYLGSRAAQRELARVEEVAEPAALSLHAALQLLGNESRRRGKPRAKCVLAALADEPGLSNAELARRSGVGDQGQMSRLLARLGRLGVVENRLHPGDLPVASNAWYLTSSGAAVEHTIRAQEGCLDSSIDVADYQTRTWRTRAVSWLAGRCLRERRRSRKSMHLVPVRPFALPLLRLAI